MNNLILVTLVGSLSLALYCGTQVRIEEAAAASSATHAKIESLASRADKTHGEIRRLEKTFVSERENIQKLRTQFNLISAKQVSSTDLSEFTPEKEGFWPANKPYFYISKARLVGLSYWPFTDDENRLSRQATTLLGMSPEEEAFANAAYLEMRRKIRDLEVAHAMPTNNPPHVEELTGTKSTIFVLPVSRENIDAIAQEFKVALSEALGQERATYLGRRIDESFDMSVYGLFRPRTLTLIRDGDKIQLVESDRSGSKTTSSTVDDDGKQIVPRHVRHLFPE